jgi:hypothetical protein
MATINSYSPYMYMLTGRVYVPLNPHWHPEFPWPLQVCKSDAMKILGLDFVVVFVVLEI